MASSRRWRSFFTDTARIFSIRTSTRIRSQPNLEKVVLARAVRLHIDDRVLVYGNKTVVFE